MRRLIALVTVAGCASAGAPPGGPEDHEPPQIIAISPDSGQTNAHPKQVEIRFDEVVSDRPSGSAADLNQLFLISPRTGNSAPNVSWHRSRITIKPRRGFADNTAYRVTMLPGLRDLRGNTRKQGASILFTTGAQFPPFSITGVVFDWAAQTRVNGAYVEAVSRTDTTVAYVTATDSAGQFDVGPLPAGTYTVRAVIDANSNRALDRNEKWDSVSAPVVDTRPRVELDVIERDSIPAIFDRNFVVDDSVTVHVHFDKPLDPSLPLQPALIRIQRPDSSELEVTAVQWARAYDRAKQARDSARRADSTRAASPRPDSARAQPPAVAPAPPAGRQPPPPPKPKSPPPERAIVVTVSARTPFVAGTSYRITGRGLRNLLGKASEIRTVFNVPKPAPRDTTTKTPADSAARRRPPGAPR